jgi:hypothetical protein
MSQRPGDAPTEFRRVSVALAGRKFFLLFLFLLASLVLYPYAENSVLGYYVFRVLGSTAIVLACTWSVSGAVSWWLRCCWQFQPSCIAC